MPIRQEEPGGGVVEVVVDHPPVNALDSDGWFALADALERAGGRAATRAVVLRAGGRGFCAGVDVKALAGEGSERELVAVNRGCAAAFGAVYDCPVPVIAAVHGFCLGGGVGLAGNADLLLAAEGAVFGLPEVDRGALGAATHLARLVPGKRLREMVYLAEEATAEELAGYGSVREVVPADGLVAAARDLAGEIAGKSPTIIRRAKESLNGIDPVDVRRSYRFEQGFTYELTLAGAADEAREAFVEGREADFSGGDGG